MLALFAVASKFWKPLAALLAIGALLIGAKLAWDHYVVAPLIAQGMAEGVAKGIVAGVTQEDAKWAAAEQAAEKARQAAQASLSADTTKITKNAASARAAAKSGAENASHKIHAVVAASRTARADPVGLVAPWADALKRLCHDAITDGATDGADPCVSDGQESANAGAPGAADAHPLASAAQPATLEPLSPAPIGDPAALVCSSLSDSAQANGCLQLKLDYGALLQFSVEQGAALAQERARAQALLGFIDALNAAGIRSDAR